MISTYLSKKLSIISFFLIILVVLLHAQMLSLSSGVNKIIQTIITQEITRIAVPLFFSISGFLFFRNYKTPFNVFYIKKLNSRIRSILIPYLLTSIIGITILYIIQLIPYTEPFFIKQKIEDYTFHEIIKSVFWSPVVSYQLWFLKVLFILILTSPLIYWIIKKIKIFFVFLFIYWIITDNTYIIFIDAFFFFYLGCYIAIETPEILDKKCNHKIRIFILFTLWFTFCIILALYHSSLDPILYRMFNNINILIGLYSIWFLYDIIYPKLSHRILNSSILSYSFFIYLGHEPLLTILKKLFLFFGHGTPINILITYIITPIISISICILIGYFLKTHIPSMYSILTGGRNK